MEHFVTIITALCVLLGSIVASILASRKSRIKLETQLEYIAKGVDKTNGRVTKLEGEDAQHGKDIATLIAKVESLEKIYERLKI